MKAVVVGPAERWLSEEEVPHFPYNKTFEEAEWDRLVVLHTSGSTGIPKPIVCRQGMLAIGDAYHDLPDWQGTQPWVRKFSESERMLNPSVSPF
jgi:acyl-coenzyme A synthetase/AMP-(fatty) acid ligase